MGNNANKQQQSRYRIMRLCINPSQQLIQHDQNMQSSDPISQQKKQQPFLYERLHNLNNKFDDMSWMNIRYKLEQGTTLVSSNPQQKYLVHYIKFNNLKEYQNFTDNLLYRIKMLRSCLKSRKYLNQIVSIFTEKNYKNSCISCNDCSQFNVYVVQNYLSHSLQDILNDQKLFYNDIKCILHSFSQVMAAYQYKRLRFGTINFSHIFIVKNPIKTPAQLSKNSLATLLDYSEIKIVNNSNTISNIKQNSIDLKTLQIQSNKDNNYYSCKISDPFIRDFMSNQLAKMEKIQKKDILSDTYKNDVLQVGKFLLQYLKEKENQESNNVFVHPSQDKAKKFLFDLIKKYMICSVEDRYNWLQIQRHFQQYNNNEKLFKSQVLMQGQSRNLVPLIKLEHRYPGYPQNPYKSSSLEKLPLKTALHSHQSSDFVKSIIDKNSNKTNNSFNKQNISDNNSPHINLKPVKKYQISGSSSNLANNQSNLSLNGQQEFNNLIRGPTNVSIQNLNIQTTNYNHLNNAQTARPIQYREQKANTGYGVVQNQVPQKPIDGKIQYNNLFNIGKAWTKFQGSFVDGSKQGPGTIYLTNGQIFTGFFVKDLANGKGSVYINGQLVLKGTWKNNILVTQF